MVNKILRKNVARKTKLNNANETTFQEFMNATIDSATVKLMEFYHRISNKCTKEVW